MFGTCSIFRSIVLAAAICLIVSNVSFAEDKIQRDLNDYQCKDVMRMTGEHRSIAVALLHGYFMGKKGTKVFDSQKLGESTDKFTEFCLDNPKEIAADVMAKYLE
jgi:hypothetical protein